MAREKTVERRLKSRIEEIGGACEKHVGGKRGDPDRLCSFPNGYHCLVETKWAEGVQPEAHQLRRHEFWRERGMDVWVVGCDRHITEFVSFAFLQPTRLSVGSCLVPGGPSTINASGGSWTRKDGHLVAGSRHAEAGGVELFSRTDSGTKARRGRRVVRGEG